MRLLQVFLGFLFILTVISESFRPHASHGHVALVKASSHGNVTSPGAYGPRPMLSAFGGFYVDPNHYEGDSYAGTRMIADHPSHGTAEEITMVGTDDGRTFWTINGRFTNVAKGHLVIDFSSKGGPKDLSGTYSTEHGNSVIRWPDGNQWERKIAPPLPVSTPSGLVESVGGFYTDPNHYKEGTFTGTRFVSCPMSGIVTIAGTDDGDHFWAIPGTYNGNTVVADFSSKGGPMDVQGTYKEGSITWQDGNAWVRPGGAMAPAPKGSSACLKAAGFLWLLIVSHLL